MEEQDRCYQCEEKLDALVYAVYRGGKNKAEDADDVVGYLCNRCRGTHKVKPLKGANDWKELEELKKLLQS